MIFDLTPLKEDVGGVVAAISAEPVSRRDIALALEAFDKTWFSLPVRRFRDAYGRVINSMEEGRTETPISSIRGVYRDFEMYGANLCEAALRQNYGESADLVMSAGTIHSLIDLIKDHQKEVEKAFESE